jgi:hypothetical protein
VRKIVTKIFIAIQSIADTTPATHHAICQILYRLRYLLCIDTTASITATAKYTKWRYQRFHNNRILDNDNYILEQNLVQSIRDTMTSDKVRPGAQPRPDIFNRPIVSYRRHPDSPNLNHTNQRSNPGKSSTYYNSAIKAAYDFSFQSTNVRHLNERTIDDIAIGMCSSYQRSLKGITF